jgi:putative glycosyltransferase (TIGR04348 family)
VPIRIAIVTPAARAAVLGNRVTAVRWALHLRALGHRVRVAEGWDGSRRDELLVALHARKSADAVLRWRDARGAAPAVVAVTGTDVYGEVAEALPAPALGLADRIVVLQRRTPAVLAPELRERVRVVVQSARAAAPVPAPPGTFQACMLAHVRAVKDPLVAARAAALLPPSSRVRLLHFGAVLEPALAEAVRAAQGPRYAWHGARPHHAVCPVLAGSAAVVVTSRSEGGPSVVSEAIAAGVPVLSTAVDGVVGLVGEDYPGLYPVGDAPALAALLDRCDRDAAFHGALRAAVLRLRPLVEPAREREAWRRLVAELFP